MITPFSLPTSSKYVPLGDSKWKPCDGAAITVLMNTDPYFPCSTFHIKKQLETIAISVIVNQSGSNVRWWSSWMSGVGGLLCFFEGMVRLIPTALGRLLCVLFAFEQRIVDNVINTTHVVIWWWSVIKYAHYFVHYTMQMTKWRCTCHSDFSSFGGNNLAKYATLSLWV